MPKELQTFSIGEVARLTGKSVHALRWFEREGLIPIAIPRNSSGQRVFGDEVVYWIGLCTRLRETGMPIAGIKEFADLVAAGPGNERARLALLERHERAVRDNIAKSEAALLVIEAKSAAYRSHLAAGTARGVWDPTAAPQD